MAQQTAVEWLIDQVEDFIGLIPVDIIEKVKEMEKEQIAKAFETEWTKQIRTGEQYYNETFGK